MISSLQDSGRESNGTADSNPDSRPVGVRPHRAPNLVSGRERTLVATQTSISFSRKNLHFQKPIRRFTYINGREKELVHLSLPLSPDVKELVWFLNGHHLHSGHPRSNSLQVVVSLETQGVYTCCRLGEDSLLHCLFVRVVRLVKKETKTFTLKGLRVPGNGGSLHHGGVPQDKPKGLILPPCSSGLCEDAVRDDVQLCSDCQRRDSVFTDDRFCCFRFIFGERHVLTANMCPTCSHQFRLQWIHNEHELPHANRQNLIVVAHVDSIGLYLCVARSKDDPEVYFGSAPYQVSLQECVHPQEETIPRNTPTQHLSVTQAQSLPRAHHTLVAASPPSSSQSGEVDARTSGRTSYILALRNDLKRYAHYFLSGNFSFDQLLSNGEACYGEIQGIIRSLLSTQLDRSWLVHRFFEILTDDDNLEVQSGLKKCDYLLYQLIWLLRRPSKLQYHRELGAYLNDTLRLPPYMTKWDHPEEGFPPREGAVVLLQVAACNVDEFRLECDGCCIERIPATFYNASTCYFPLTVTEQSSGSYRCVAYNRWGNSCTAPVDISVGHIRSGGSPSNLPANHQPPDFLVTRLGEQCVSCDRGMLYPGTSLHSTPFAEDGGVLVMQSLGLPRLSEQDELVLPPLPTFQ